jgi:hypothetical protein
MAVQSYKQPGTVKFGSDPVTGKASQVLTGSRPAPGCCHAALSCSQQDLLAIFAGLAPCVTPKPIPHWSRLDMQWSSPPLVEPSPLHPSECIAVLVLPGSPTCAVAQHGHC